MKTHSLYIKVILIYSMVFQFYCQKGKKSMKNVNEYLAKKADEIRPLLSGMKIPVQTKSLMKNALENRPSILIFYRGGWCPYCNLHFGQLKNIEKDLLGFGYTIIAISPDKIENLKETIDKYAIKYKILSDSDMEITRGFGLAYQVDETTFSMYKTHNLDIEKASGKTHHLLPVPAIYIISSAGVVLFNYVNPDYKVRINPDLLLAAARILYEPSIEK